MKVREKREARPRVVNCEGMQSGNYVRKRKTGQKKKKKNGMKKEPGIYQDKSIFSFC